MNGGTDSIIYCTKCFHHFGLLKNNFYTPGVIHGDKQCDGETKAHKPVYAAVFLTQDSKKLLLEKVPARHPTVFAEHMTLAFGRHMRDEYPIGKKIQLYAYAHFADERGQCVSVWSHQTRGLLWENQIPHVTISCAEGVKPFYSMEILKDPTKLPVEDIALILEGTVDYFPRIVS
jgi:hypothetical protein